MNPRKRAVVVLVLGIVLLVLVMHDLYGVRMAAILEDRGAGYLLGRVGRFAVPLAVAAVGGLAALAGVVLAWRRAAARGAAGAARAERLLPPLLGVLAVGAAGVLVKTFLHGMIPTEWTGLLAMPVAASVLLFAFFGRRGVLLGGHVVIVLGIAGAWLGMRLQSGHAERAQAFAQAMDQEARRLEMLRHALEVVDATSFAYTPSARASAWRFDDHLDAAMLTDVPPLEPGAGTLYEIPGGGTLEIVGEDGSVRPIASTSAAGAGAPGEDDGALRLPAYRAGTVLRTAEPLDLDPEQVGSLVIRMRVSAGRSFWLYWSATDALDPDVGIQLPLGPHGEARTYEVSKAIAESSRFERFERIRRVFLVPSNADAEVVIESFRVLDRVAAVSRRAPLETSYEDRGGELRRVLGLRAPITVTWAVQVPARRPRLRFGLALAEPRDPVGVTIEVTPAAGRAETVYVAALGGGDHSAASPVPAPPAAENWLDAQIDLARWAGQTVEVTVRAEADRANVVYWSNPVVFGERAQRRPNVVVYLVDALRADHLSCYGYGKRTSPELDAVAAAGALFEQAFSNATHTKPSIPTLMTSNPVVATGVRERLDVLPSSFPTLAEVLRSEGYATAALVTNRNVGVFSGTHQGFSQFMDAGRVMAGEEAPRADAVEGDADVLVGGTLASWLDAHADREFFLYVHTIDAHGPYDPPHPFRRAVEAAAQRGRRLPHDPTLDPAWLEQPTDSARVALYDGEIAFGDEALGTFVRMMQARGLWENTLFVFTADHGEYLGERGKWGHEAPPYYEVTHIPLLVAGPGVPGGVRVVENVQNLDVMPTVLEALGLTAPPDLMQGASLLPLARGEAGARQAFAERLVWIASMRQGQSALLFDGLRAIPEKNFLFDRARDPRELDPYNVWLLDLGLKSRARRLAHDYARTYATFHAVMAGQEDSAVELDPETVKQLRALGYIE